MKVAVFDTNYTVIETIGFSFSESSSWEFDLVNDDSFLSSKIRIKKGQKPIVDFGGNHSSFDAVLINLEAPFNKTNRNDYKAIDVIFWLRIKYNYGKPIILTGFQSLLSVLKQKPTATILNATNVFFIDVLSDFNQLNSICNNAKNLSKETIREEYLSHAKNFFDLTKVRHEEANWFAVKTIYDINSIKGKSIIGSNYSKTLKKHLKELNNLLAVYIYTDTNIESVSKLISDKKEEQRKGVLDKIKDWHNQKETIELNSKSILKELEEIRGMIEFVESAISDNNKVLNDDELAATLIAVGQQNVIEETRQEFEENENYLSELLNQRQKLEIKLNTLSIKIPIVSEDTEKIVIDNNYSSFFTKTDYDVHKEVVLIDDLANLWKGAYKAILGENTIIQSVEVPFQIKDSEEQLKVLLKNTSQKITDLTACVLLDLRIFNHDKTIKPLEDYSGLIILKELKRKHPFLPIIITTASNKIWTYKKTLELGADAFWVKEGVDNYSSIADSINNIEKLKEFVFNFSNPEYKLLRKIGLDISKIENSQKTFWWESMKWIYPPKGLVLCNDGSNQKILMNTNVEKEKIVNKLKESLHFYAHYLRGRYITNLIDDENINIYISAVINHFGKIIESVHPYLISENDNRVNTGTLIRFRGDSKGGSLYNKRNQFSHDGEIDNPILELDNFSTELLKYLSKQSLATYEGYYKRMLNKISKSVQKTKQYSELGQDSKEEKVKNKPIEKKVVRTIKEVITSNEKKALAPVAVSQSNREEKEPSKVIASIEKNETGNNPINTEKDESPQLSEVSVFSRIINWFKPFFKS